MSFSSGVCKHSPVSTVLPSLQHPLLMVCLMHTPALAAARLVCAVLRYASQVTATRGAAAQLRQPLLLLGVRHAAGSPTPAACIQPQAHVAVSARCLKRFQGSQTPTPTHIEPISCAFSPQPTCCLLSQTAFLRVQTLDTNSMVEEMMLLANVAVASAISARFPSCSLLRRHQTPGALGPVHCCKCQHSCICRAAELC